MNNASYDNKLQHQSSAAAPPNLKLTLRDNMVDEHSSTPLSKHCSLRSSNSRSTVRKSTNMLTEKDLG